MADGVILGAFTLNIPDVNGYFASKDILKTFNTYNVEYSKLTESLVLNTDTLPARPSNLNLIEHFYARILLYLIAYTLQP